MPADREEEDALKSPLRRWIEGQGRPSYVLTRFVLLRLLGLVYFVAFMSALLQARGLVGEHGLLPMRAWLSALARVSGGRGLAFVRAPSLFWIDASDTSLVVVCALGAILSLAVVVGVTNAAVMLALWILQTSLHAVGQVFWGYGWEIQLLETGMIAVFLCPLRTWRARDATAPPEIAIWLMRWLVVRIMLGAGFIKMRGDPCWRELTCLLTHYETQPNPSPLSWVLHQMPPWFHQAGVLFNHFVELFVPVFALGPRRTRHLAGGFMIAFQAILIASGNLSFLNWLTIVPAIACFDDGFWPRRIPRASRPPPTTLHRRAAIAYAALVAVLSVQPVVNLFSSQQAMNAGFDPLYLVNTYGAFGSVSKERDEIVVEGSDDGVTWKEYELPCKPGDVLRRPCLVTPYHYRLDWQMWFAAMSSYEEEPWFVVMVDRLLRGEPAVLALFAKNPFPDHPPRFVRAELYRYRFTRWGEGPAWWRRERIGEYLRPVTVDDPDLAAFLREHRYAE